MWDWTFARDYCRSLGMDLPTIRSRSQITTIFNTVKTDVWIGLFLDRWAWSDESPTSLRYWMVGRPANLQGCAVVSVKDQGRWYEEQCEAEMPFVCQGGEFCWSPPQSGKTVTMVQKQLSEGLCFFFFIGLWCHYREHFEMWRPINIPTWWRNRTPL